MSEKRTTWTVTLFDSRDECEELYILPGFATEAYASRAGHDLASIWNQIDMRTLGHDADEIRFVTDVRGYVTFKVEAE